MFTKQDLLNLYNNLNRKDINDLKGVKFAYCLSKNRGLLKTEVEALDKAQAYSEEFTKLINEFEPERLKIAEKYTEKDEKGESKKEMKMLNGREVETFVMTKENQEKNNKESDDALKAKNPELYQAREKQIEEYNNLLKEEYSTMQLHKVLSSELPADITGLQIELLKEIIRD